MEGRWTLCANMRPGCEGAPIVRYGPPIKPYDHIEVVPRSEAEALAEALEASLPSLSRTDRASYRRLLRAVTVYRSGHRKEKP